MIAAQYILERTQRSAKCSFCCLETAGSCVQGANIRQRRCRLAVLFTEPAAISTQDTTQKCLRLAQSSEVNQDGSEGSFIRGHT
jgi:hypothetical protein